MEPFRSSLLLKIQTKSILESRLLKGETNFNKEVLDLRTSLLLIFVSRKLEWVSHKNSIYRESYSPRSVYKAPSHIEVDLRKI